MHGTKVACWMDCWLTQIERHRLCPAHNGTASPREHTHDDGPGDKDEQYQDIVQ
jgi:hypothetical protein